MRGKAPDILALLLIALSALSLVMLAASSRRSAQFSWQRANGTCYFVGWHRGKLHFARQHPFGDQIPGYVSDATEWGRLEVQFPQGGSMSSTYGPWVFNHSFLGVQWLSVRMGCINAERTSSGVQAKQKFFCDYWTAGVPWWWIAILAAVYPFFRIRSHLILRRRKLRWWCMVCGYDLRESRERCPECGTPIAAALSSTV